MSIKALYLQGYSIDEIAFSLNMSVWVVRSMITKLGISRPRGNRSSGKQAKPSYLDLQEKTEAASAGMALDIMHRLSKSRLQAN